MLLTILGNVFFAIFRRWGKTAFQSLSIWSSQFLYVVIILPHDQDCMKNRVNYECESTIKIIYKYLIFSLNTRCLSSVLQLLASNQSHSQCHGYLWMIFLCRRRFGYAPMVLICPLASNQIYIPVIKVLHNERAVRLLIWKVRTNLQKYSVER